MENDLADALDDVICATGGDPSGGAGSDVLMVIFSWIFFAGGVFAATQFIVKSIAITPASDIGEQQKCLLQEGPQDDGERANVPPGSCETSKYQLVSCPTSVVDQLVGTAIRGDLGHAKSNGQNDLQIFELA